MSTVTVYTHTANMSSIFVDKSIIFCMPKNARGKFAKTLDFFCATGYNIATALDGELAALCNLQSATVGSNTVLGLRMGGPLPLGGDDVKVLCNVCLRTVSGLDRSSTKQDVACATR